MSEPYQADHDLLIRIETKLDIALADVDQLKERVTLLERASDRLSGLVVSMKVVWIVLTLIAGGVVFPAVLAHWN